MAYHIGNDPAHHDVVVIIHCMYNAREENQYRNSDTSRNISVVQLIKECANINQKTLIGSEYTTAEVTLLADL